MGRMDKGNLKSSISHGVKWHVALQHFFITLSRHISETVVNLFVQSLSLFVFFCYMYLSILAIDIASLYILVTRSLTVLIKLVKLKLISNVMFGSISIINNILEFSVNMIALSLFSHCTCCPHPILNVVD